MIGVLLAETVLLLTGFAVGQPLLGAALAGALAYFLLAYRDPPLAWAIVWVLFPFSIEFSFSGGNAISVPTEPLMVLALLAWVLRALALRKLPIQRSPLDLPIAAMALIALTSVFLSPYPGLGLKAWVASAGYVAFAYAFVPAGRDAAASARRWVPWVLGCGAFWGLFGTARVLLLGPSLHTAYGAARPFFVEHGTYAAFLAMLLPLACLFALETRGRERIYYTSVAVAMGLGIVFSFTRAAWISLALVLPGMAFIWVARQRSLRPLALLGGIAVLLVVVVVSLGVGGRLMQHAGTVADIENASNLERMNRWMAAAEMIKDRPILGVGYGTYQAAYTQYRRKTVVTEWAFQHMGVHSEPLRLLSETGTIGFLASLWLLGTTAFLAFRAFHLAPDPRARVLAVAALSGLATYAIHGVFNSYLGLDKVTIPFWAGLGLLAALERQASQSTRAHPVPSSP